MPTCFTGFYDRTASFFENSPLKAEGQPSTEELVLLEPMRDKLRPEVFGEVAMPQESDGSGQDRKLLRAGLRSLLDEAGWKLDGTLRRNAKGETFDHRIPDRRSGLRARVRALCAESEAARHRCPHAHDRPGAV